MLLLYMYQLQIFLSIVTYTLHSQISWHAYMEEVCNIYVTYELDVINNVASITVHIQQWQQQYT